MEIKKKKKNRNKEAKYFYEQLQVIFVIDTKIYKQFIQITPSSCFTRMSFFQLESASFEKSETKNWKEKKSIRDHWNDAKIKLVNPWFLGKKNKNQHWTRLGKKVRKNISIHLEKKKQLV